MVTEASRVRDVGPILLTGAPGIAGRHLFAALAAREAAVVAVSRRRGEGWTVLDVADPASLSDMPDVAGIIHCAGATPRSARLTWRDFYRDNVLSTVFLARRAARRQSLFFIYVSTMGSLRQQRTRVGRLYVISKRLAERCLRTILDRRVALWILRAGTLYGEHDQGSVARLIRVVARRRFVMVGSGRQRKCLLYAGSLANTIVEEIAAGEVRGTRLEPISDGTPYRFGEIIDAIEAETMLRVPRFRIPDGLLLAVIDSLAALGRHARLRRLDELVMVATTAFRDVPCQEPNALDRHPNARIGLREGIRREVAWMRACAYI